MFGEMPKVAAFQLKNLHAQHREILRRRHVGEKCKDIARDLGVSVSTVSHTVAGQLGMEHMERMAVASDLEIIDVRKELDRQVPKAVLLLADVMEGRVPTPVLSEGQQPVPLGLRMKAGESLLDRAGLSRIQKVQGQHAHIYLDKEAIERIKARGREMDLVTPNRGNGDALQQEGNNG